MGRSAGSAEVVNTKNPDKGRMAINRNKVYPPNLFVFGNIKFISVGNFHLRLYIAYSLCFGIVESKYWSKEQGS